VPDEDIKINSCSRLKKYVDFEESSKPVRNAKKVSILIVDDNDL